MSGRHAKSTPRRRLPQRRRGAVIGAIALAAIVGGTGVGHALWSDRVQFETPTFPRGTVAFGARGQGTDLLAMYDGTDPVSIVLPGSVIAEVLNQTSVDADPVIWRFEVVGRTMPSLGMDYTITLATQIWSDESETPLSSGIGDPETLLYYSTIQFFPEGAGGDCPVPGVAPGDGASGDGDSSGDGVDAGSDVDGDGDDVSGGDGDGNSEPSVAIESSVTATLFDSDNQSTEPKAENWCAAIRFNNAADMVYSQQAWVTGEDLSGKTLTAFANLKLQIASPPSLPLVGYYVNTFTATGIGVDKSLAKDDDTWYAAVYPDPSDEPDLRIDIKPVLTRG